jgi:non-ribosomal peptide synthetase component F
MGVLSRELNECYAAALAGRPPALPELPIQYADFALWQRRWLSGERLEQQLAYWRAQLAELPQLALPTDRPRPSVQSFRGAVQPLALPARLTAALRALSRTEGTTLFMTLLAAFQSLLARYSGQDDIVVGTPIAGRNRAELEPLIGFFVNSLVLRSDLSGNPSFRELLARVREVALAAYAHQDLPFEMLVEDLQPERDASRNPLFQVMFQLFSAVGARQAASDGRPPRAEVRSGTAKFDLFLDLWEAPHEVTGGIEYSTDLFDADTVARLAGHFRNLLEGMVADPERPLSQLPLLAPDEHRRLVVDWNATARPYPREACVHELFEAQAARTPDAPALVFGERTLSYAQLNERANRLAHRLRALGVGPDRLVGVCLERSLELPVALLAVLKAGGAYLPLDPGYPTARLAYMLADANAPVLLTQHQLRPRLPDGPAHTLTLDDEPPASSDDSSNPESGASADNLAYVIYTSGSTGTPKGGRRPPPRRRPARQGDRLRRARPRSGIPATRADLVRRRHL